MTDEQRLASGEVKIDPGGTAPVPVHHHAGGSVALYVLTAHTDVRVHLEYCDPSDAFVLALTFAPGVDAEGQAKLTNMALRYAWANLFRLGAVGEEMPAPVRSQGHADPGCADPGDPRPALPVHRRLPDGALRRARVRGRRSTCGGATRGGRSGVRHPDDRRGRDRAWVPCRSPSGGSWGAYGRSCTRAVSPARWRCRSRSAGPWSDQMRFAAGRGC